MEIDYKDFNVLVFDLGNVIIHLNDELVLESLSDKSDFTSEQIIKILQKSTLLPDFEIGSISEEEFFDGVKALLRLRISFAEFKEIWNSTLHDLPESKIRLLEKLKTSHQVYVLSNTNAIHKSAFDKMVQDKSNGRIMDDVVHKAYYSHEMGMRKPNEDIYLELIRIHDLNPEKVLFFDDRKENIEAANKIGINGIQVKHPDHLWNYFND